MQKRSLRSLNIQRPLTTPDPRSAGTGKPHQGFGRRETTLVDAGANHGQAPPSLRTPLKTRQTAPLVDLFISLANNHPRRGECSHCSTCCSRLVPNLHIFFTKHDSIRRITNPDADPISPTSLRPSLSISYYETHRYCSGVRWPGCMARTSQDGETYR